MDTKKDELDLQDDEIESIADEKKGVNFVFVLILVSVATAVLVWSQYGSDKKDVKKEPAKYQPARPRIDFDGVSTPPKKTRLKRPTSVVIDDSEQKRLAEQKKQWEMRMSAAPTVFDSNNVSDPSFADGTALGSEPKPLTYAEIKNMVGQNTGLGQSQAPSRDKLSTRLNGATTATVTVAQQLQNTSHLIAEGKSIDCILDTALNSQLPGKTRCLLSEDVYSYDGSNLLIPKGSRVNGEYEGGLSRGQERVFIIWTRILTPNGLSIAINSPSADSLGRSGQRAYIDNHFFERFGAATLMSIVGALPSGRESSSNVYREIGSSFNRNAEIVLEDSIGIRPTGSAHQGSRIKILVARDIDFSGSNI